MIEKFGEEYINYMKKTKMFVPHLFWWSFSNPCKIWQYFCNIWGGGALSDNILED
jgi:hypothetical protein